MPGTSYLSAFWHILRLARTPNLIIIFLTQYCTAIFLVGADQPILEVVLDFKLFLLSLSTIIIAAGGYYINDYYDIKIDLINKPDKVIVGNVFDRRTVLLWHSIFNFAGIAIGTYVSIWVGMVNVLAAFLLWIYSNQLKRMPLIGNLTIAFLTSLSLVVLIVYYRSSEYLVFIYAFFAFGITLIREIIKDLEDMKGDSAFGSKSLPILLGMRKTKWVLYFLILIFSTSIYYFAFRLNNHVVFGYFLLLSLPSIYLIYMLIRADTVRHFFFLSQYCKWLMVGGILSMILI